MHKVVRRGFRAFLFSNQKLCLFYSLLPAYKCIDISFVTFLKIIKMEKYFSFSLVRCGKCDDVSLCINLFLFIQYFLILFVYFTPALKFYTCVCPFLMHYMWMSVCTYFIPAWYDVGDAM